LGLAFIGGVFGRIEQGLQDFVGYGGFAH
jgi:hypothetical protein